MAPPISHAKLFCGNGKHWVEAHFRSSYVRYDGVRVKSTQVSGHCRKNPRGYDQWHRTLSSNRPKLWGYKKEKSKKWTVEEIQRLYDAISVLPDKLLDLKDVKIYRMSSSKDKGNPGTSNSTDIVLYDQAFKHKDSLAQILSHELSHVLYDKLSLDEKDAFAERSDWIVIKMKDGHFYVPKKGKVYLQEDSKVSLGEDFANHIEEFLFKRDKIKRVSPKATKWIDDEYGNSFRIKRGRESEKK